ncbi:hypothetical protein WHK35_14280, partial [Staphylococcus aureus]|uniref:hypothetical protein n=1 Tax=Staphylococcus aureus TaxID=1280 RepID=UPI0039BEBC18
AVLSVLDKYWPRRDLVKDGPLLQMLGTDWGRKTINENIWVSIAQKRAAAALAENPKTLVIVGDCRFPNEFEAFPEALRVRLECPEDARKQRCSMWRENTAHASETGLDELARDKRFDLYLYTNTSNTTECVTLILAQLDKQSWAEK